MFLLQDQACFPLRMFLCGEAGRNQGRIYSEMQHLRQPGKCADLQNCINDTTESFKKVCGTMRYSQSMLRRSERLFRWSDAELFIQRDLSGCPRHFNCWHAGHWLPKPSPTITSPPCRIISKLFCLIYIYTHTYIYISSVRTSPLTSSQQSPTDSFHSSCAPAAQHCSAAASRWSFSQESSFTSYWLPVSLPLPTVPPALPQV